MKKFVLLISILAFCLGLFAAELTIGTGTNPQRFPLGSFFGYERSAALYTAAEIGAQNTKITKLAWYSELATTAAVPTKIYLKTTTASTLSNGSWASMISGSSRLYDQIHTGTRAYNWNWFELDNAFDVDMNQNLIVLVERNYGGSGSGAASGFNDGAKIRSSSCSGTHIFWQSDNQATTSTGSFETIRPNLRIYYTMYQNDLVIGSGSEAKRFPLASWYGYERSAALYTAAEIGMQNIDAIAWYPTINTTASVPTKIYLKTTTASTLSNDSWANMISGATLLYDQNRSGTAAGTWNMFDLNINFLVNLGESLIVLVERNYGGTGSGAPGGYSAGGGILASSCNGTHRIWHQDSNAPSGNGESASTRPNVRLRCNSTIASFPFVEGFERGNTDQSAAFMNWTQILGPSYDQKQWAANSSETSYNRAPRNGSWNATLANRGQSYLIRPIELIAGTNYSIELYARHGNSSEYNSILQIKYGAHPSIAGMNKNIVPETRLTNGDYQRISGVFSPETTGLYYIGIQGYVDYALDFISLDDIKIDIISSGPHALPFIEGWDSGDSGTNYWTRETGGWTIYPGSGKPVPTAEFNGNFAVENAYSSSLCSFELDATGIYDVTFSFDMSLQQHTGSTAENQMIWQVHNGNDWITVGGYNALDGDLIWTHYSQHISEHAANRIFKIRFVAFGEDASEIIFWFIDNIVVRESAYNTLPFTEDWSSEDFGTNYWSRNSTNWRIADILGNPTPAVYFSYSPRVYDYNSALTSYEFDARDVDSVELNFDLQLTIQNTAVENWLTWEVWNGANWITLGSYSSLNGNLPWSSYSYDISAHASNRLFKIRFVASGGDSNKIHFWVIDNIHVSGTGSGIIPVAGLSIERVGPNFVLNWTATPSADWYRIYNSVDPYESFAPSGWTVNPPVSIPITSLPGNKRFFKVEAQNGPSPSREQGGYVPLQKIIK